MITNTETVSYEAAFDVEFDIEEGTDIVNWVDPDDGQTKHRMTGIYPSIVTESQIKAHWAYNALANGVSDASELDGWADLPSGTIRFRIIHTTVEVEER